MVIDTLRNASLYSCLGTRIKTGLDFLTRSSTAPFHEHTDEIDGRDVYALFQTYLTEGDRGRFYEAHQNYLDIQFILSGLEVIRVTNVETLQVSTPYDSGRDVAFYNLDPGTDVILHAGDFAILYPHEAHLPKLPLSSPAKVEKIVVKVRL